MIVTKVVVSMRFFDQICIVCTDYSTFDVDAGMLVSVLVATVALVDRGT